MASDRSARAEAAPLVADLIGANQRMRDTLAMVFNGPARGRCVLATGDEAEAVIVNLDGAGAQADWARYRDRHPGRPAIVLSLDPAPVPGAVAVVVKPVRIEHFLEAVSRVRASLGTATPPRVVPASVPSVPARAAAPVPLARREAATREPVAAAVPPEASCDETGDAITQGRAGPAKDRWDDVCGHAPDCDLGDEEQVEARRYAGSTAFLDHLREAREQAEKLGTAVAVTLRDRAVVTVGPPGQPAGCALTDDQLRALCGTDLREGTLGVKACSDPAESAPGTASLPLEALQWKVALWTYRGQLPRSAPVGQRVYLAHWPNLTRLLPVPCATRISALLVRHPMRLADVAEILRIPQRYVFAFFGAAETLGIMGVARRETDYLLESEAPEPHSRRSLLERIARQLPGARPEDAGVKA